MKIISLLLPGLLFAAQAVAASNQIYLTSEKGEKLLKGESIRKAAPEMRVSRSYYWSPLLEVEISGEKAISMTISAPLDEDFQIKTYDYIRDDRENLPRSGGFYIAIDSWTLSNIQGKIQILDLAYDKDRKVERLAFDFILNDSFIVGFDKKMLSGSVRFHSDIPISDPIVISTSPDPVNAPHSEITTQGRNNKLEKVTDLDGNFIIQNYLLRPESGLHYERLNLSMRTNFGGAQDLEFELVGEKDKEIRPGLYTYSWPGLSETSFCSGKCPNLFNIREVARDASGKINKLAVDIDYGLGEGEIHFKERKSIRYHSDVPVEASLLTNISR